MSVVTVSHGRSDGRFERASVIKNRMEGPVVETSKGKVRGFVDRSILGDEYLGFKGIPFAKPPVGQLRFQVSKYTLYKRSAT